MKFIDLFAGVGGFHLGLERSSSIKPKQLQRQELQERKDSNSIESAKRKQSNFSCVWANEWDKYAGEIYKKRFPETKFYGGDIRTVDVDRLPEFDLLCGGFPCQSFSIAGKRKGFDDTRGTLFFEIARIIKAKRPKIVLLENVKGLLSHEGGKTFGRIIEVLGDLGYWVEWEVLNSKNFGVPQNRERVFVVGHLRGESQRQVFPFGQGDREIEKNGKRKKVIDVMKSDREISRIYDISGLAPTLHLKTGGWQEPKITNASEREFGFRNICPCLASRDYKEPKIVVLPCATKQGYAVAEEGDGVRLQHMDSKTARGRVIKGKAQTLQTSGLGGTVQYNKVRRLTPTECERLQGFPDNWTEGLSDTQRYKCMGNAVTVNVVQAIGEKLFKSCNSFEVDKK